MSVYLKEQPDFLSKSIESILNQTVVCNDFVIIQDGPLTKELEDVLKKYENNKIFNIIKLKENVGLGRALNIGVRKCKNELIARMDSDDISMPNRCEKQLEYFLNNPKLDILGTFMYEFYDDSEKIVSLKKMPTNYEDIYNRGKTRTAFCHPTIMFKKSVILENGNYCDARRAQDFELFSRLLCNGVYGENIPLPLLKFRRNTQSFKRRKSIKSIIRQLEIINISHKKGYSSFFDLIKVFFIDFIIFITPIFLLKQIFKLYYKFSD